MRDHRLDPPDFDDGPEVTDDHRERAIERLATDPALIYETISESPELHPEWLIKVYAESPTLRAQFAEYCEAIIDDLAQEIAYDLQEEAKYEAVIDRYERMMDR